MSSIILLSTINQLLDEIKYPDHVSKLESAVQYLYTALNGQYQTMSMVIGNL